MIRSLENSVLGERGVALVEQVRRSLRRQHGAPNYLSRHARAHRLPQWQLVVQDLCLGNEASIVNLKKVRRDVE